MLNFFRSQSATIKNDVLSGITVALALVPEAIAFAFVAGVLPQVGLYSAFFIGLITAILGGRPGMISGATGAMAVVVVALVLNYGVEYLFPCVILCGIMQVVIGLFKLGKLIRIVPHPVMLGFVNGLAVVIGMAQLDSFRTLNAANESVFLTGLPLAWMAGLVAFTMLVIWGLPKITTAVPSSLVAILGISILAAGVNSSDFGKNADGGNLLLTVGDMLKNKKLAKNTGHGHADAKPHAAEMADLDAGTPRLVSLQIDAEPSSSTDGATETTLAQIDNPSESASDEAGSGLEGGLPKPFFFLDKTAPVNFETLRIIFPFAIILCGVGLIESLMTLTLIDEITETRGRGNRECVGQGIANVVCGFFGGMGGCAMIGQSLINVNSGGRGRLSGIVAACCLLSFVLFLADWIAQIPMAALVGVMFMVVIGTFEWASLRMFRRMPRSDVFVMIFVTLYTVFMHDLASAVILGVVVSALVFAWQHATHMGADVKLNEFGSKIYQLHGPLFFASVSSFKEMFDVVEDPDDVVIDFYYTRVYDQSGLEAINSLAEKYEAQGKRLHLTHLSEECRLLLDRAGDLVEINVSEDPHYHIAADRLG